MITSQSHSICIQFTEWIFHISIVQLIEFRLVTFLKHLALSDFQRSVCETRSLRRMKKSDLKTGSWLMNWWRKEKWNRIICISYDRGQFTQKKSQPSDDVCYRNFKFFVKKRTFRGVSNDQGHKSKL